MKKISYLYIKPNLIDMLALLKEIMVGKKTPAVTLESVVKNTQFKSSVYTHELEYNEWCRYIHKEVRKKYYSKRKRK